MAKQQDPIKAQYYEKSQVPGDLKGSVVVCFSGGGSRACTAAMEKILAQIRLFVCSS